MLPVSSSASNNLNHPIHKSNTRQGVLQAEGEKARTIVNVDVAPKANKRPRLLLNLSAASREISIGSGLEGDVFKDKNNPGFVNVTTQVMMLVKSVSCLIDFMAKEVQKSLWKMGRQRLFSANGVRF